MSIRRGRANRSALLSFGPLPAPPVLHKAINSLIGLQALCIGENTPSHLAKTSAGITFHSLLSSVILCSGKMNRATRINLPPRLLDLLQQDRRLHSSVLAALSDFEPWLEDNKLVFFQEYTDHGPDHISSVIDTAAGLITESSWKLLTAADAAALTLAVLLHDCAMHISEDGFMTLVVNDDNKPIEPNDPPWPKLWNSYIHEAARFDGKKLLSLFGNTDPVSIPQLQQASLTRRDRMLIGDFLRRHHPRLAFEIAAHGVPAGTSNRLSLTGFDDDFKRLVGRIARSHGTSIREAVFQLDKNSRRLSLGSHTTFLMALLRIADYLQIQASRAPQQVLQTRSLLSPFSQAEWQSHRTVVEVSSIDDDRESLYVTARLPTATDFVRLKKLLASLQAELDQTWAVLGEVYGPIDSLRDLGLTVRRIKSNIDDVEGFANTVSYIPVAATFTAATADLLKLLIGPLYSDRSQVGIRELLQNALDAVLERRDVAIDSSRSNAGQVPSFDVSISVTKEADGTYLTVADSGIGMTQEVILNYFLRAGASFRFSDAWQKLHTNADGESRVIRSGRFGIGALAAYLLGDSVSVTTRGYEQASAITFDARIEDTNIELRKTSAPIGTTVRIRLRDGVMNTLGWDHASWDFYCGSDLKVERVVDGNQISQTEVWPACNGQLPPTWRRLSRSDFLDIQWSYWEPVNRTLIACNGIRVEEIDRNSQDDEDSSDHYYRRRYRARRPKSEAKLRLSVFDPAGRLPLNLQRTSVTNLPFRKELDGEIAKDLLAFAATRLPESREVDVLFDNQLRYPGVDDSNDQLFSPNFLATPYGWTLPSSLLLTKLGATRLVYTITGNERRGKSRLPFDLDDSIFLCPFLGDGRGDSGLSDWLESLIHYPAVKVLVPWKVMQSLFQEDDLASVMRRAKIEPAGSDHSLLSFGREFQPSLSLLRRKLMPQLNERAVNHDEEWFDKYTEDDDLAFDYKPENDWYYAIAEASYEHNFYSSEWPRSYEIAAEVWNSLGIYSIPFATEDRASILTHPQIEAYAAAHFKLWEEKKETQKPQSHH